MNVLIGNQVTSVEANKGGSLEVPDVPTTTVVTTASTTAPLEPLDVELVGAGGPGVGLPEGSPSHPTITAACGPGAWMQQLTEGQTNEPRREDARSSEHETYIVETLLEGCQMDWVVGGEFYTCLIFLE